MSLVVNGVDLKKKKDFIVWSDEKNIHIIIFFLSRKSRTARKTSRGGALGPKTTKVRVKLKVTSLQKLTTSGACLVDLLRAGVC